MAMAAAIDSQAAAEQAALIARAARRDPDGLHDLAALYARPLHRFAWRMLFDSDESEQVVQDAFARLWGAAPRWREGDGRVGQWFYRVCTHLCLERLRRRGEWEPDPAAGDVVLSLARLSDRGRAAIVLTRCEALPNAIAADMLHLALPAFEDLLSQARMDLLAGLRRTRVRVESLNQLLDEVRPLPVPPDFPERIAAAAIAPPAVSRARRSAGGGVWTARNPVLAGAIAASVVAAATVTGVIRDREAGRGPDKMAVNHHTAARTERTASATSHRTTPPAAGPSNAPLVIPLPAPTSATLQAEAVPPPAPAPDANASARAAASEVHKTGPARSAARRMASVSATIHGFAGKGAKRKRSPRPPIQLLPAGFVDASSPSADQPVDPVAVPAAQERPPALTYAQLAAERRRRMRDYLRTLSADELRQFREEERAVRHERRENKRSGLAQLPGSAR